MRENTEDLEKEDRIKKEKARLKRQFAKIDKKKKSVVEGLIERAAFMRIMLEDMEADIKVNGYVEKFSQGQQDPYDRKRPVVDSYNTMNANYQKIIKQLTELMPKEPAVPKQTSDGFDEFVNGRED